MDPRSWGGDEVVQLHKVVISSFIVVLNENKCYADITRNFSKSQIRVGKNEIVDTFRRRRSKSESKAEESALDRLRLIRIDAYRASGAENMIASSSVRLVGREHTTKVVFCLEKKHSRDNGKAKEEKYEKKMQGKRKTGSSNVRGYLVGGCCW
ncbi:hypothetical protein M0804_004323 [Polistes exclamans]|nr:hypothetical protein M0804_004323 [Polistes exclamans]